MYSIYPAKIIDHHIPLQLFHHQEFSETLGYRKLAGPLSIRDFQEQTVTIGNLDLQTFDCPLSEIYIKKC